MSFQELSDFLYAAEHNLSLRKELKESKTNNMIISIAMKYGFRITKNDLIENSIEQRINSWFEQSKIKPFKK